jgi:hypothetical protein
VPSMRLLPFSEVSTHSVPSRCTGAGVGDPTGRPQLISNIVRAIGQAIAARSSFFFIVLSP